MQLYHLRQVQWGMMMVWNTGPVEQGASDMLHILGSSERLD